MQQPEDMPRVSARKFEECVQLLARLLIDPELPQEGSEVEVRDSPDQRYRTATFPFPIGDDLEDPDGLLVLQFTWERERAPQTYNLFDITKQNNDDAARSRFPQAFIIQIIGPDQLVPRGEGDDDRYNDDII